MLYKVRKAWKSLYKVIVADETKSTAMNVVTAARCRSAQHQRDLHGEIIMNIQTILSKKLYTKESWMEFQKL